MTFLIEEKNNICKTAYALLHACKISKLPLDLFKITKAADIKLIDNKEMGELKPGECGLSIYDGCKWHIIYDNGMSLGRIRFTIAHELGHISLNHMHRAGNGRTFETEADLFASYLLAPPCILSELNAYNANSIRLICDVSKSCSKILSKTMIEKYLNKNSRSKLEKDLINNFRDFILNNKLKNPFHSINTKQPTNVIYNEINKNIRTKPKLDID